MKGYRNEQLIWIITISIIGQRFGNCVGQEKPFYNIPSFSKESVRQNFCDVLRSVEDGQIERRDALRGMDLCVVLFPYQLNAEGAIDREFPDVAVLFLDELSRRAGFQWRNTFGVANTPRGDETWTDVLDWTASTYDLVGEWFKRSQERFELGVIFSESWVDTSTILVKMKGNEEEASLNFFNFLTPFALGLWGWLGLTMVVTGFVYYLLDYLDSRRENRNVATGFRESMFNAAWLFTGHTLHQPKSGATRLLVFSSSFFCLLIVAAYTANLASFLVADKKVMVINDINDVITRGSSMCIDAYGASAQVIEKNYPKAKLVKIKAETYDQETYHALGRKECSFLITDMTIFENHRRSLEYNSNCNLEKVGRTVKYVEGYFPVMDSSRLCTSLITEVITLHLLEMKLDKTFNTIWEIFYSKSATVFCTATQETNKDRQRISAANMFGIFVIHFAALLAGVTWSVLRFQCYRTRNGTGSSEKLHIVQDIRTSIAGSTTHSRVIPPPLSISIRDQICQENLSSDSSSIEGEITKTFPLPLESSKEDNITLEKIWGKMIEMERGRQEVDKKTNQCLCSSTVEEVVSCKEDNITLEKIWEKVTEIERDRQRVDIQTNEYLNRVNYSIEMLEKVKKEINDIEEKQI